MSLKRKLTVGISAVVAGTLALSACSTSPSSSSGGDANTLTIFWKGSEKAGIEAEVAAFKAANAGVNVTLTTADTEQYQATIRTQLSAGTASDVFYAWPGNGNPGAIEQLAPGGYLEDLSGRSWANSYPDAVKPFMSYQGKTVLMGTLLNTFGAFYNETALKTAGLTPPKIWSEVLPFCAAAKAKGKVAYAMGAATLNNVQNTVYNLAPTLVYGAEPTFDDDLASGKTTFATNKGWKTTLDYFKQMLDAGCFNANSTGANNDAMLQLVAKGDALGTMPSALQLAALRKLAGASNPIVYQPVSGGDDPNTGIIAAASSGGGAVNAKAKNKELALKFVDFMASTPGTEAFVNAMQGPVAAIPNDALKLSSDSLSLVTTYLKAGRTVHFLNQAWPNAQTEQAMFSGLQGMIAGTTTADQVLSAMDTAYKSKS